MRILRRYLLREILVPFGLGVAGFTGFLVLAKMLRLADMVLNRGVPVSLILQLLASIFPTFLEVTVPMAVLLAVIVAFGRLSSESELTAMQACGLSLRQLAMPAVLFGFVTTLLSLVLSLEGRPFGNRQFRTTLTEIGSTRAAAAIREKVFTTELAGVMIYADRIIDGGDTIEGVLISDSRNGGQQDTIVARQARMMASGVPGAFTMRLAEGSVHTWEIRSGSYQRTEFGEYDLHIELVPAAANLRSREPELRELGTAALHEKREQRRQAGESVREEDVEWQRRLAVPAAAFVFAILGVPLGIQPPRSARSRAFGVSVLLITVYYLLLTLGEHLGRRGPLPVPLLLWAPNLLFLLVGGALFLRRAIHPQSVGEWFRRGRRPGGPATAHPAGGA